MQAYSIALKRAEEASSDEMARDWSDVAATIARSSGRRASLLDALFGLTRRLRLDLDAPRKFHATARGREWKRQ
jgi:hypothetical protein